MKKNYLSKYILKMFLSLSLFIFAISCQEQNIINFQVYSVGECVREVDSRLIETDKVKNKVYRVDARTSDHYLISVYSFNRWIDLRQRELDYFKDGSRFSYISTTCPGSKPKRTIGNTIKMDAAKK